MSALSAYLAMESGNPYVTYGITEQVFKERDTGGDSGRDDSASGAGSGWSMTFITIVSSACTTVRRCGFRTAGGGS